MWFRHCKIYTASTIIKANTLFVLAQIPLNNIRKLWINAKYELIQSVCIGHRKIGRNVPNGKTIQRCFFLSTTWNVVDIVVIDTVVVVSVLVFVVVVAIVVVNAVHAFYSSANLSRYPQYPEFYPYIASSPYNPQYFPSPMLPSSCLPTAYQASYYSECVCNCEKP